MPSSWPTSLLGSLVLLASSGPNIAATLSQGQQIYEHGVPAKIRPALGTVQGDVPFDAQQLVCASCHRRSGLGSSEGGIVIPAVTGDVLFSPRIIQRRELWGTRTEGKGTRPAYTAETLARAIREGVDAAGRPLDPLMPRYALDDAEMNALLDYLQSLSSQHAPGVDASSIHFATITSDRIAPDSEDALLSLLRTFFATKNAQTRREGRRAANPPWHKENTFPAYRTWVLHHWRLQGPTETWAAQLESLYARQPVFAILSGSVGTSWAPIHRFAEANGLPTLFPHTDQPEANGYYTFYTHEGVALRAKAIAEDLLGRSVRRIIQVIPRQGPGRHGAAAFRASWHGAAEIVDVELTGDGGHDGLTPGSTDAVLWWAESTALATSGLIRSRAAALYLAADPPQSNEHLALTAAQVFAVHPFRQPDSLEAGVAPLRNWLRVRGLAATDLPLMADAFLAATATGEALMHMNTHFSRHYFIEKLEHGLNRATFSGLYPALSSAPGQRFVVKGSHIVELDRNARPLRHRWVVP